MDLEDKVQGQTLCLVGTGSLYGTKAGLEQCWNNRHKKLGIALQYFLRLKLESNKVAKTN